MQRTVKTTTLIVEKPAGFTGLEATFKLIRYELPAELRWRQNRNDYGQMHNSLRDQLDYPYKAFKYDRLDGGVPKWVVYVLYPRDADVQEIAIPFLKPGYLPWRAIAFSDLGLHLLLKLLHIAYFRGVNSQRVGRFIGQDLCYVYARYDRVKKVHVCLQIELKGDIRNEPEDARQEFKVLGRARPLRRVDNADRPSYAYFGSNIKANSKDRRRYFLHLKRAEVTKALQSKEPVYAIFTQKGQRTTLAYHDLLRIEASVGKILYDFVRGFSAYLDQYGISCAAKERTFTEFLPPDREVQLPLANLNAIRVYDNRLARNHPLQGYLDLFARLWPDLTFTTITDLSAAQDGAVLVVQDHNKEDFLEGGVLEGQVDPYTDLYTRFPQLPKQSIDANSNEGAGMTVQEYLEYPLPKMDDEEFQQKVEMALSQLYLKSVILYEKSVRHSLPLAPVEYVFIRRGRSNAETYETLLWFDGDRLRFLDLRDPAARQQRDQLLLHLGVDWHEMHGKMLRKYRKAGEDEEAKELPSYNVIVGQGLFIELEGMDERVLYDYDEIMQRQAAVETALPIEVLKLAPHYDAVRSASSLPFEELLARGLLDSQAQSQNNRERESVAFYRQLEQYDAFLDEVGQTHPAISFHDLTQGELWEEIIRILDIQPDKHGHYTRGKIKGLYQKMGWFSSDKAKELHLYEGIWYDEGDYSYLVGSAQPMKPKQPRAHLIRRFDVYMGADHFDIGPLLLATSVQFVRLNQYTVYPYAFHLIDLYVENVLRFL